MAYDNNRTPDSAEAKAKKKAQQLVDGQKAMHEYEMGMRSMREKTERLKALRLAHEEAEAKRAADAPPAPVKKKATKKAKVVKAAPAETQLEAEAAE